MISTWSEWKRYPRPGRGENIEAPISPAMAKNAGATANPASTSAIAPCLNVIFAILIVISQEISADFQIISKGYNIPARQQAKKSPPAAGS